MNELVLLTPTRNRPQCFALLERYMQRQSVKWKRWLVCNDGQEEYSYNLGQEVILRDPSGDGDIHSICHNYRAMLERCENETRFCFIEDDDWYRSDFLELMDRALERADMVGTAPAWYYNLWSSSYKVCRNTEHCSLAQTAMTSVVVPYFLAGCDIPNNPFIDMFLWSHFQHAIGGRCEILPQGGEMVGLKSSWGELGIGLGHRPDYSWQRDPLGRKLREWIGADADNYIGGNFDN